jgi:S1-C subfamily serine protease
MNRCVCIAHRTGTFGVAVFCLFAFFAASARADQLIMNDGTVLEGTVLTQGDKYWVKGADGKSQIVAAKDVKKYVKGSGAVTPAAGATGTATAAPTASVSAAAGSADFASVKRKADAVETPMAAVTLWQKFTESKPSAADLAAAKAEMDKWQKMADEGAEKVNGKWVSGEAMKELHAKVRDKLRQAAEDMHNEKTLQALKTLEEARKLYPNSFEANFMTGYLTLLEHRDKDAISYLEQAVKLRPDEPAACNNLGIALFATRTDLQRGIVLMHHAVEIEDSKETVHNLVMSLALCPKEMQYNPKVRPAIESARLLASKYSLDVHGDFHGDHWTLMPYTGDSEMEDSEFQDGKKHSLTAKVASGTGFVINDDGLILTNRHVVDGATSYLVILDGGVKKAGEIVVIDTDQDLALLRVKPDAKLPVVKFSDAARTAEGAACFAMGFPLIDRMGASIKVTQGIVSGSGRAGVGADVVIDAKVNPGNSGGPLLDKYGRLIGIITMKTRTATFEDSYGLAIGVGKIREFLEKNKVTVANDPAGAAALSAEEVVAKVKPATVCIIATHDK